ncbi:MAG: hypothetical protein AAGE84_21050 [Cyanobacteria bacterium P01_G01_bin.39]
MLRENKMAKSPEEFNNLRKSIKELKEEFRQNLSQFQANQSRFDQEQSTQIQNHNAQIIAIRDELTKGLKQVDDKLERKIQEIDNAKKFYQNLQLIVTTGIVLFSIVGLTEYIASEKVNFFQGILQKYYPPKAILQETKAEDMVSVAPEIRTENLSTWVSEWTDEQHNKAFGKRENEENPFYEAIKEPILRRWDEEKEADRHGLITQRIQPKLLFQLGQSAQQVTVQPIGNFKPEITAKCNNKVGNDTIAAYIIIDPSHIRYNYPWFDCKYKVKIGIRKNYDDKSYLIEDIDVAEVRRDTELPYPLSSKIVVRLTPKASENIDLSNTQTLEAWVNLTEAEGYRE